MAAEKEEKRRKIRRRAALAAAATRSRAALERLHGFMHGPQQLRRATILRRGHAFLGGPEQGLDIGLPADEDRLLLLGREARRAEHVLRRAENRGGVELG